LALLFDLHCRSPCRRHAALAQAARASHLGV